MCKINEIRLADILLNEDGDRMWMVTDLRKNSTLPDWSRNLDFRMLGRTRPDNRKWKWNWARLKPMNFDGNDTICYWDPREEHQNPEWRMRTWNEGQLMSMEENQRMNRLFKNDKEMEEQITLAMNYIKDRMLNDDWSWHRHSIYHHPFENVQWLFLNDHDFPQQFPFFKWVTNVKVISTGAWLCADQTPLDQQKVRWHWTGIDKNVRWEITSPSLRGEEIWMFDFTLEFRKLME